MNTILSLLDTERHAGFVAAGHWGNDTIYALAAKRARLEPDAVAVTDRFRRLTYSQLVESADALAGDLSHRGVRPGERVAVWLPSSVETAIAMLAASRNGFVCCTSLHRDHTVMEVVALAERMRAAALIASPGYGADADRRDIFTQIAPLATLRHVYRVDRENSLHAFPEPPPANAEAPLPPNGDPNRVIYLPFTSGTTGIPKGVLHSDNTLLATARSLVGDWSLDQRTVIYTLSPLSHNLGLGALITAIVAGCEIVVHDLPKGGGLIDRLVETNATFLFGVPTHAIDLVAELRKRGLSRAGAVRAFRVSGAAAPPEIIHELMRFGITPQSGYGMTETCSHQYTLPHDGPDLISGSCGKACAGYQVRIWRQDNPDVEAAIGEIGQIGGRGASLMLGYFDDQEATENSFNSSGWFMTGDLGWIDADGYLRITGRKKDIIIRGGHNIYPARIEALAGGHPDIERAAAFPVADARLGEKVCLALVTRHGANIEPNQILQFLDQSGLSKYDMPEYLLFLDAVPLTASGKIIKRDLAASVASGKMRPIPVRFSAATAGA